MARRPKPGKLEVNEKLAAEVEAGLRQRRSPEQIFSNRLRIDFPGNEEMWVSDETIYKTLFVQGRGGLQQGTGRLPAYRANDTPAPEAEPALVSARQARPTWGDDQ